MDLNEVRWSDGDREVRDPHENRIDTLFMAYPWDVLAGDEFGKEFIKHDPATFIEPPWRTLLSSKGMLCALWDMFPNHPNLLPASYDAERLSGDLIRKPVWGWQGSDVSLICQGTAAKAEERQNKTFSHIYQRYSPLPQFSGYRALTRSWVVGDKPSGISMAEQSSDIVDGAAKFVPHYIR
jgi:glutathionylspermidine synthase